MASAGLLALLPHLAAFIVSNSGGFVADRLLLPRVGLTRTRKLMQLAAQLGPCAAFTIFAINPAPGAAITSVLSTVAIACGALRAYELASTKGRASSSGAGECRECDGEN